MKTTTPEFQIPLPMSIIPLPNKPLVSRKILKTHTIKPSCLRSPFIVRAVDLNKSITHAEKNLYD